MNVAFIGMGAMGRPMARNLIRAGHAVTVWNRTRPRAEELGGDGARIAENIADAARGAEAVITMLADDRAVERVARDGGGILDALAPGAIHVSMSTISPALASALDAEHRARRQGYVAAPVFGRPEAAAAARLFVVAAGAEPHVSRSKPLLEAVGREVRVVGSDPAMANVVKLAGNFLIASMLEALGESFALVRKSGIGARSFLEIVNDALFQSPLYANYGAKIAGAAFEPAGFRLRLGLKDIGLALAAAEERAVPMPLASLLRDHFLTAIAHGKGDSDWAAIAAVSADAAGLGEP